MSFEVLSKYCEYDNAIVSIKNLNKVNLVKLANGCLVLGLSKLPLLPQLPQKMTLASKMVKIN